MSGDILNLCFNNHYYDLYVSLGKKENIIKSVFFFFFMK